MILRAFLAFFLLVAISKAPCQDSVQTQLTQPYRFELEKKYSDEDFTIISLKEEGLALLREKNKYKSGNKTWALILLDSTLQEKQNFDFEIDQRKNLIGYEYSTGFLYLLYKTGESVKIVLDLISVQLDTRETQLYEIKPELPLQLTHFSKVADNFIFGGYVNSEPAVLLYYPAADNLKVIPGFFQKQTELVDLRPNQNQTFNTILVDRGDRTKQNILFKTFDFNGVELLNDVIPINENYVIQTGISSMLIREELTIIGTWGTRNSKQSLGFYSVPINPFTDQKIHYTAFGELEHYLDDQNPKRAKKIKEKTKESLLQNRYPDFSSYVMPYKIDEQPEGFLLLAEVYVPTASLNRYPDSYPYGYGTNPFYYPFSGYYPGTYNRMYNPYNNSSSYYNQTNTRNPENIKATQSVLIAFDGEGKTQWDYSLIMEDLRTHSLEQIADFCVHGGKIHFLFKKESELKVKTITLENEEYKDYTEKIRLLNEGDEIRSENKSISGVRQWYKNNFYVWGEHSVRNKSNRTVETRQVFYVNKVVGN